MTFDVYVIDSDGDAVSGREVEVIVGPSHLFGVGGPVGGRITEYTDDDGHAAFETADDGYSEVTIYVGGDRQGKYDLEDGAGFTISL